jgi:hypothetical protein
MSHKLHVPLFLFVIAFISASVISLALSPVPREAYAQTGPTSTPIRIVKINSSAPPAPFTAISLENDSIRRLYSCKVRPGSTPDSWAFSSQGASASLYSGAKLTIDPSSITFVEAQPTLCTTTTTQYQAFAIGPDGRYYLPTLFKARGTSNTTATLVSLPLSAYIQPGIWRLGVNDPNYFDVLVEITRPARPFFLSDVSNSGLLGGFTPNEPIKGILFARAAQGTPLAYAGDFNLRADANGYVLFTLPNLTTERLEDNYLLFAGRDRHFALSNLLETTLALNSTNLSDLENSTYAEYWVKPFVKPTATPQPPVVIVPSGPSRDVVPPNSIRLGEFQVESYCNDQGYGVKLINNENDWACTRQPSGDVAFTLSPTDFDTICRKTYNAPGAYAIRDQHKPTQAYNWSCYVQANVAPPIDAREVPPVNSIRLGEFQVEQYCTDRGYGVTLTNNNQDWACKNQDGSTAFILGANDFDAICQRTYNRPDAFAIQDQRKAIRAHNWSCYMYR